jgi:hypothetical protein
VNPVRLIQPLDRPRNLAIVALLVAALGLAALGAATGLEWLSAHWSAACRRLLHVPTPPNLARPWRLPGSRADAPCLRRRP